MSGSTLSNSNILLLLYVYYKLVVIVVGHELNGDAPVVGGTTRILRIRSKSVRIIN